MGLNITEIGTHSLRKGVATALTNTTGGPQAVSVWLRAGWSLGGVQGLLVDLADEVLLGVMCNPVSKMMATGIPPHVAQSDKIQTLENEVKMLGTTIQHKLDEMPAIVAGELMAQGGMSGSSQLTTGAFHQGLSQLRESILRDLQQSRLSVDPMVPAESSTTTDASSTPDNDEWEARRMDGMSYLTLYRSFSTSSVSPSMYGAELTPTIVTLSFISALVSGLRTQHSDVVGYGSLRVIYRGAEGGVPGCIVVVVTFRNCGDDDNCDDDNCDDSDLRYCMFGRPSLDCCIYKKQTLILDELADPVVIKHIHEIRIRLASSMCRRGSDVSWYDNNSFVLKHLSKLPGWYAGSGKKLFVARAAIHPYEFLPEALWGCSADIMGLTRALDRDIFVFAFMARALTSTLLMDMTSSAFFFRLD
ncbi:hypothetical protein H257_19010 [Aphanomyces astaci]|uniref:Uncharacterized protein n=1 Tax=Aphanomyces astaci TaxID=112090 RepID=W4F9D1_APHAT|nr:hypothetical protein H257_19010 [Aphanomyces astaci]ETV64047.1 hypothetical protein H257_19010 [Aphanomyces astaci]|eukprot:XP_009846469.1 hypothetical protein H257_19010 [Aphanomyces astaci]